VITFRHIGVYAEYASSERRSGKKYYYLPTGLDFFRVKLERQQTLSVDIKYCVRETVCNVKLLCVGREAVNAI